MLTVSVVEAVMMMMMMAFASKSLVREAAVTWALLVVTAMFESFARKPLMIKSMMFTAIPSAFPAIRVWPTGVLIAL